MAAVEHLAAVLPFLVLHQAHYILSPSKPGIVVLCSGESYQHRRRQIYHDRPIQT